MCEGVLCSLCVDCWCLIHKAQQELNIHQEKWPASLRCGVLPPLHHKADRGPGCCMPGSALQHAAQPSGVAAAAAAWWELGLGVLCWC